MKQACWRKRLEKKQKTLTSKLLFEKNVYIRILKVAGTLSEHYRGTHEQGTEPPKGRKGLVPNSGGPGLLPIGCWDRLQHLPCHPGGPDKREENNLKPCSLLYEHESRKMSETVCPVWLHRDAHACILLS